MPKSQKFGGRRRDSKEYVLCFLDSTGPFATMLHDVSRNFPTLIDRAYTWYQPKARFATLFEHLMSIFNAKLFYVEAKFSHIELKRMRSAQGKIDRDGGGGSKNGGGSLYNETVRRAPRPTLTSLSGLGPVLRKRTSIATLEKGEGSSSFSSERPAHDRRRPSRFPDYCPSLAIPRRP